jgi:molybdenum cofactor biosynthesis protein B
VTFYVVTVSSGRFEKKESNQVFADESGDIAEKLALNAGHTVVGRGLISDNKEMLRTTLKRLMRDKRIDVVVFSGGTGISPTDITIETLRPFFEKEIDGFGEFFRKMSFDKIGPAAFLSRATAGIVEGKVILCLPGSPDAVTTAMEGFLEEIPHAVKIARA